MTRILLDTGPLVAMINRRDSFHSWSVKQAGELAPPFYTCEAVIAEAHHLLGGLNQGNRHLIQLLESGKIILTSIVAQNLSRIGYLMLKYSDVPMSFADACLLCMAEQRRAEKKGATIFTLDSDFHVYRLKKKESLRLIIP